MKVRNGFVSNSSTTSFCIYGAAITKDIADKIKAAKSDLDIHRCFDAIYAGIEWCAIGDNETGLQFKNRIAEELKKFIDGDLNCGTIEEAWQDG